MRQTTGPGQVVKDIKRARRKQHSSEEKNRVVLDGLRGEDSIAGIRGAKFLRTEPTAAIHAATRHA